MSGILAGLASGFLQGMGQNRQYRDQQEQQKLMNDFMERQLGFKEEGHSRAEIFVSQ